MTAKFKALQNVFMAVAVASASGNALASPEAPPANPDADGQTETISFHGPTGCEAMATTNGQIEVSCFGNPYDGDPNPGMNFALDLNASELTVSNRYDISTEGVAELEGKEQTYPLSMTTDMNAMNDQMTEADFTMPDALSMGDAYRNADDETGLYKMQSDQSNLSVTLYDPGRISESFMILEYHNPADGSQTRMMANASQVFVQTAQPGETPSMSMVELDKNFSKNDFRHKPTKPKAPGS